MCITINIVIGEKTIDLSYPIGYPRKEIVVMSMFGNNTQYEIKESINLKLIGCGENPILNGTYTLRQLSAFVERGMIITDLNNHPQVIKTDKLAKITEMTFNFNELDNGNNLEDGRPSNTLFKYHVSSYGKFTHVKPHTPQYKKLKNGEFTFLTLKITNQNNNIITNGSEQL